MAKNINVSDEGFNYGDTMVGTIRAEDDLTLVTVEGEVDVYSSGTFKEALTRQIDKGRGKFIIDFTRMDFIDSSGLGTLISCMRRLVQEQGSPPKRIQLVVPKEASKKIFRITGLDRIFPIYDTLEVAKENFETAEPGIVTGSAK